MSHLNLTITQISHEDIQSSRINGFFHEQSFRGLDADILALKYNIRTKYCDS